MQLHIASEKDSDELISFFKEVPLSGHVELKVNRISDFFTPYQIQGDQNVTFSLRNEDGLHGVGTFVIRDAILQNKVTRIAFGRDLKISSNRQARMEWGHHYLPLMKDVREKYNIEHFFTNISYADLPALNTFVRPRSFKRPLPRYFLFRKFNLISVHGRLPWATHPLPHLKIKHASDRYADALAHYIITKSANRDLATVWNYDSFKQKVSKWINLHTYDFLIAVDNFDNIVGCCAPWSAQGIQEYIPLKYSLIGHNFRQFLKFASILGWTRKLTKPAHRLKNEESLNFKYLLFLNADNEDIFESLLWRSFDLATRNEFLIYTQIRDQIHFRRPIDWVSAKVPYGCYYFSEPDRDMPEFIQPNNIRSMEMEPFFV